MSAINTTERNKTENSIRVASFNVSMEAHNYSDEPQAGVLREQLKTGKHPQIAAIAQILQRVRPDIVLLNEFDYAPPEGRDIALFIQNYLLQPQNGQTAIAYPYVYTAPVNTGELFPLDINNDGVRTLPEDAYGFGYFPGHYGMVLLSRYPIEVESIRSFRQFLWRDMPGALKPVNADGTPYWPDPVWQQLRLSSKSHWDVPVTVKGQRLHLLLSHPTPPVFDGPEDRNGRRNHDEIRLWADYLSGTADYLYDDQGKRGGIAEQAAFVVMGDLNASPHEGESVPGAIAQLLKHPRIIDSMPASEGARQAQPENPYSAWHTASWAMRVDYVLPSSNLQVLGSGVFWPTLEDPLSYLIADRGASSDHRLVWVDIAW